MEYIKNHKIFEGAGDNVPDDDETLLLLKDLTLEISDLDPNYKIEVGGFGTYGHEGHNDYHVTQPRFIKREDGKPMDSNYKYAKDEIY